MNQTPFDYPGYFDQYPSAARSRNGTRGLLKTFPLPHPVATLR